MELVSFFFFLPLQEIHDVIFLSVRPLDKRQYEEPGVIHRENLLWVRTRKSLITTLACQPGHMFRSKKILFQLYKKVLFLHPSLFSRSSFSSLCPSESSFRVNASLSYTFLLLFLLKLNFF